MCEGLDAVKDTFGARAHAAVRAIPPGRVASYGAVAAAAGRPGAARAVGRILRGVGEREDVPWWRVINSRGEITIPRSGLAASLQRALLEEEGIEFDDAGRVDMPRFGWHFGEESID
jgi:methylated-DNA-protein-cysteine methyltransferase related protein